MDVTNILEGVSGIVAAGIAAGTVIFGVSAWRREYVGRRRIELAEEVLALFYEARYVISAIRNPFGFVGEGSTREADPKESPEEKQISDNAYKVFERYNKHQGLFSKLHSMRYSYMAQFGKDSAKPFDDLREIINDIFEAATMLPYYWQRQGHTPWKSEEERQNHLDEMHKYERVFWHLGKDDPIEPRVDAIISDIEKQTSSIISKTSIPQRAKRFCANVRQRLLKCLKKGTDDGYTEHPRRHTQSL